jgi:hypothetical protein
MIRGRRKNWIAVAGASALVTMASLALVPLAASAQPVGTTVTAMPPNPTTGASVNLTATVVAVTTDASTPTGTVVFTITGSNASVITCKKGNTPALSHSGTASCKILGGQLQAADSPYAVTAVYSGDSNFTGSTGNLSLTVGKAKTKTKVKFVRPKPKSGNGETFIAKVTAGKNGSLLSGNVVFAVASTPSTPPHARLCAGGDSQPLAVSGNVGTAECVLSAGWFVVPGKTKSNPHPHGSWNVSASYTGNANLNSSVGTKSGHAK